VTPRPGLYRAHAPRHPEAGAGKGGALISGRCLARPSPRASRPDYHYTLPAALAVRFEHTIGGWIGSGCSGRVRRACPGRRVGASSSTTSASYRSTATDRGRGPAPLSWLLMMEMWQSRSRLGSTHSTLLFIVAPAATATLGWLLISAWCSCSDHPPVR
jgi:hypothetical protein